MRDYDKALAEINAVRTAINDLSKTINDGYASLRCANMLTELKSLEWRVKQEQIMSKHNRNPFAS